MRHPALARLLFILGVARLAAGAPLPESPARPAAGQVGSGDLAEAVRGLLKKRAAPDWRVGVLILDEKGRVLVGIDADRPLSPASNQKVLVVGAALGILGPGFRYQTTLAARDPPREGTIGDLVVGGDGDPNISGRFHGGDPTALFRAWSEELKRAGVRRIAGDLVVDDHRFDGVRFLPGWKVEQAGRWYSAEVGALNLNDNCIDIAVRPGEPGQRARVELKPPTAYVSIDNRCRTVATGKEKPILHRKPGTNTIIVSGAMPVSRKLYTDSVTVEDPGLYFGAVLCEALRAGGIALEGRVVRARSAERAGLSPHVLVRHTSTLAEDLSVINKRSQNLHAEVLLKGLGARAGGEGSVEAGERAISGFLRREGLPADGLQMEDGSGLAAGNRVSPATLAAVLSWIQRRPFFEAYRDSLPVASRDGTLERRFRGRKCAGSVFAKTGYIASVSALSGYIRRGDRHWVFVVLVNGLRGGGSDSARALQEEIAEAAYQAMPEALPAAAPR